MRHTEGEYHTRHVRYQEKSSWKKKLGIAVLIILLLLAAAVAGIYVVFKTGYYGKSNYRKSGGYSVAESIQAETFIDDEGKLQTVTEATLDEEKEAKVLSAHEKALESLGADVTEETGTYNLLLIGVDRRDDSWNGNSDVMMLITVNNDKKTIYMTSFLRDLYANIPEVGVRKLNASCAYGGPELCVETIKSNYSVEIDNYAMVDFNAMIDIVDALGGVELELTDDEARVANRYVESMCSANGESYESHQILSAGMQLLDGYQAVAFARNRYSGNTYDFGRTQRQRKVLMAIFNKAKTGSLGTLNKAAESVLPYVTHDISELTILKLLTQISGWLKYDVVEQHIPYDNMYHSENEILIPDMEATITKLRETIY